METTHRPAVPSLRGAQQVQSSIDIDAPIERVWAVVTDPATFPEAIDWVDEAWTDGEKPLDVGSIYFERGRPGFRRGTYRWEVVDCDPPHRMVHVHASGELQAELELELESLDEGRTRYTQRLYFRALPAFRPLGYVLERTVMRRSMQRDFDEMILPNFKRLTEERTVPA